MLTQDQRTEIETVRYFEMSVNCFHCALFNIPEEYNNGTVKPAYNGTARDHFFLYVEGRFRFHSGTRILDLGESIASVL